jgi:vitamin B12 transporter
MRRRLPSVVFVSLVVSVLRVRAEEPQAPPPLPPAQATIIVTADRIEQPLSESPDSVTVIGAEELRASQAATVVDALRDVAGLGMVQSGSSGHTAFAFLRGASPSQALVLVDGVDVNNPFFGGVDLSGMLASGVSRIEIVRGPQSPLYGSDAMAGVVNIITGATHEGRLGEVAFEGGSLSTFRESVQLGETKGPWRWSLTGARHDTGGQFTNDDFAGTQVTGSLRRELAAGSFTLTGLWDDSRLGIPFSGSLPTPERRYASSLGVGGVQWEAHASALVNLDVKASVARRTEDYRDPEDPFTHASYDRSTRFRGSIQNLAVVGAHAITLGVEQQYEDVVATSNGDPALDEILRTSAVYGQDRVEIGRLAVTVGGRWDHHSSFGGHFSPRVSLAYRLSQRWRLRAAGGSAFRAPSAGELAYPFYGNPALDPETSRSYEAGVDLTGSRVSASLTAFHSEYRNLITFDPSTFLAATIAKARIRGAELTAGVKLTESLRANAAYTFLNTRDETTGARLYRRPRHAASLSLAYTRGAWSGRVATRLFGRRLERDFDLFADRENGGYATTEVAVAYQVLDRVKVHARLENLFDKTYDEILAYHAPGRTFFAGVQLGF